MKKVFKFCIDENIPLAKEAVEHLGSVRIIKGRDVTNKLLLEENFNVLFIRSQTKVDQILCDDTNVEFIATATAGFDHFDVDYLKAKAIPFFASPGCNANSVAEYVIYGILKWAIAHNKNISELVLGIVGFGNIGKLVAKYGKFLGMKILVNDPPLFASNFNFPEEFHYLEIDDLIANADVITNHVPLEKNFSNFPTLNLFNQNNLELIKNNSLFIHASRGSVVDELALIQISKQKNISLIVDVWKSEPHFDINLAQLAMISTPHVAGHSYNGKLNGTIQVLNNFEQHFGVETDKSLILKELEYYKPLDRFYYSDTSKLLDLIASNRLIDLDDALLKSLAVLNSQDRSVNFDLQRKNYPLRKEVL